MLEHVLKRKVYYSETDAQGIMYHANYVKFLDHARTEALASKGFKLAEIVQDYNVLFAVHKIEIEFSGSAKLEDELFIVSRIVNLSRVKLVFSQDVYLTKLNGSKICQAAVTIVCLDENHSPTRLPEHIKLEIQK